MPNLANLSIEFIILALRIAIIFLLYLFLYQVVRVIVRELRSAGVEQQATSQYGSLVVVNPGQSRLQSGRKFPLGPVNTIGRSMDNDVPLDDSFLSGEHAMLQWDGQAWVLEDLESTNGTRVNGREVTQPMSIDYGDTIQLGHIDLKLSRM